MSNERTKILKIRHHMMINNNNNNNVWIRYFETRIKNANTYSDIFKIQHLLKVFRTVVHLKNSTIPTLDVKKQLIRNINCLMKECDNDTKFYEQLEHIRTNNVIILMDKADDKESRILDMICDKTINVVV